MSRLVVVSGGGTGIGRAVARRFAQAGDEVVVVGRRAEPLQRAVAELGPRARALAADLTLLEDVERVAASLDAVDVVVNNAGGYADQEGEGLAAVAARWEADYRKNLLSAVLLTTALLPKLSRPGGRIVSISSVAAVSGGGDSYSAAKAALHGWSYSLARQVGKEGITVNVVAPGFVDDTEFFHDPLDDRRRGILVGRTLVGRGGRPDDVAEAVAYLASEAGGYVTGEVLHVNGGTAFGR